MTTGVCVYTDWPFGGDALSVEPEADPNHVQRALDWIPALSLDVVKIHSNYSFAAQIDRDSEKHLPIAQVLRRTNS
jgi:hypothetical protein